MPAVKPGRIAAVLALSLAATSASAQKKPRVPKSKTHGYSQYERQAIDGTLERVGREVDPAPEGKTIEAIDVVRLQSIEPRDPAPEALNVFHVLSREEVIAREVLLRVGEPYTKIIADETARNLRLRSQLSLVVVMAVRGSSDDKVRVVVLTKDVWSLRLSWDIQYTKDGMRRLVIQPSETNLAGLHHTIGARYVWQPETNTFGTRYTVPRLFGSRVQLIADANAIFERHTGAPEGTVLEFVLQKPLWSTQTPWAWAALGAYSNDVFRSYKNASLDKFEGIPFKYRRERAAAILSVTRSFGWEIKHDVGFGVEGSRRAARPGDLSAYAPASVSRFVNTKIPRDDARLYPFLEGRAYTTDFLRTIDMETLSLQEDVRLGHDVSAKVYPVSESVGSSRTYVGLEGKAQMTLAIRDGYARASVTSKTEHEHDGVANGQVGGSLRVMTPRLGIGRLVFDSVVLNRYRNALRDSSFLGGDTGLRGYPAAAFSGANLVRMNVELRTKPAHVYTVQVGGVVFYDAGGAFDRFDAPDASCVASSREGTQLACRKINQAAGAGVRFLFPQLDRSVFRIDLGVPLEPYGRPGGVAPFQLFLAFGQAFPLQTVAPSQPVP